MNVDPAQYMTSLMPRCDENAAHRGGEKELSDVSSTRRAFTHMTTTARARLTRSRYAFPLFSLLSFVLHLLLGDLT